MEKREMSKSSGELVMHGYDQHIVQSYRTL